MSWNINRGRFTSIASALFKNPHLIKENFNKTDFIYNNTYTDTFHEKYLEYKRYVNDNFNTLISKDDILHRIKNENTTENSKKSNY